MFYKQHTTLQMQDKLSTKSISLYTIMLKVQIMLGEQPSVDVQLPGVRESLSGT